MYWNKMQILVSLIGLTINDFLYHLYIIFPVYVTRSTIFRLSLYTDWEWMNGLFHLCGCVDLRSHHNCDNGSKWCLDEFNIWYADSELTIFLRDILLFDNNWIEGKPFSIYMIIEWILSYVCEQSVDNMWIKS
jgi:hypothetical protein